MRIREPRSVMNVRPLPDVAFGPRDIMWWGTLGFVVIEGWAIVLTVAVFVYLHQNQQAWPPPGTRLPDLMLPSILLGLMVASLPLTQWIDRVLRRYDLARTRTGFSIAAALGIVLTGVLAAVLVKSLNVKWNSNAYGSAQWLVLTYYFTLVLVEACEVTGLALAYWFAPVEDKHFSDGADAMFYWRFMVAAYAGLYVVCFWLPRWM